MQRRPPGTGTIEIYEDGTARGRLPRLLGRGWLPLRDTPDEAAADLAVALEEAVTNPPEGLTVSAWGDRWLKDREASGHYRSSRRDRNRWKVHVDGSSLGAAHLTRVEAHDVRRWLRARPCGAKTAYNALILLRGALQSAVEAGLIATDPTVGVRLPKGARAGEDDRWTWLRGEEIAAVLQAAEPGKQRAVLAVAIFSGLRRGEIWGLTWEAVDFDRGELVVRQAVGEKRKLQPPKNGKARRVPLLAPARAALEAWREMTPRSARNFVFPGRDAGVHHPDYDAGLRKLQALHPTWRPFRFHDLRHTAASHLLQGTWAPLLTDRSLRLEEVQLWLGHSSRIVTERYAHLCPDGIRSLVRTVERPAPRSESDAQRGPAVDQGSGGPCRVRTGDRRVKSLRQPEDFSAATIEIPAALVQRLVQLRDELRDLVVDRDPFAIHRALDLAEAVDEIEAASAGGVPNIMHLHGDDRGA